MVWEQPKGGRKNKLLLKRIRSFLNDGPKNFQEIQRHFDQWPKSRPTRWKLAGILSSPYHDFVQIGYANVPNPFKDKTTEVGIWANRRRDEE